MKLKIFIATLSLAATSAFAGHAAREAAKDVIPLKDGGRLYIFNNGKMAKEDRWGRAEYLKKGVLLETVDGRSVPATSNEVALLHSLLLEGHSGN